MKKIMKRLITMFMVLTMLLSTVQVQAAAKPVINWQTRYTFTADPNGNEENIGDVTNGKKVSVSSSNKAVVTVRTVKNPYNSKNVMIYVKARKSGTVILTLKVDGKSYRSKIKVLKYANGIDYIKIGTVKIPGSKFDKAAKIDLKYSQFAGKKCKVTIKMKKGWYLGGIQDRTQLRYPIEEVSMANNTYIKFSKKPKGNLELYPAKYSENGIGQMTKVQLNFK